MIVDSSTLYVNRRSIDLDTQLSETATGGVEIVIRIRTRDPKARDFLKSRARDMHDHLGDWIESEARK
jgi:hypothetical protein